MTKAVGNVNGELNKQLSGRSWSDLVELDQAMRDLDGTPNKARLGANALIGTSMARALAASVAAEGHCTGLGDEGGFAPNLVEPEEVLQVIVDAIDNAGYPTGRQGVGIALDPAASEFFSDAGYKVNGQQLSSDDMIARYAAMIDAFPIWSSRTASASRSRPAGSG